jgi:predicted RNase H-like HicB family nuclease
MSTSPHIAVVIQLEDNGTVSAYVPGLPGVYAAADTQAGALRGIREALGGYLEAMRSRGWALPAHLPDPAEP